MVYGIGLINQNYLSIEKLYFIKNYIKYRKGVINLSFITEIIAQIQDCYRNEYINPVTHQPGVNYKLVIIDIQKSGKKKYVEIKISEDCVKRLNIIENIKKYQDLSLQRLLGQTFYRYDGINWLGSIIIEDIKPLPGEVQPTKKFDKTK